MKNNLWTAGWTPWQRRTGCASWTPGARNRTVEKLADRGAIVRQEIISPWRFDAARNRSMDLIPPGTDVCVCTDLDEVFRPGWRKLLENVWEPGTEQLRYIYIWSFGPGGTPGHYVFTGKGPHARRVPVASSGT